MARAGTGVPSLDPTTLLFSPAASSSALLFSPARTPPHPSHPSGHPSGDEYSEETGMTNALPSGEHTRPNCDENILSPHGMTPGGGLLPDPPPLSPRRSPRNSSIGSSSAARGGRQPGGGGEEDTSEDEWLDEPGGGGGVDTAEDVWLDEMRFATGSPHLQACGRGEKDTSEDEWLDEVEAEMARASAVLRLIPARIPRLPPSLSSGNNQSTRASLLSSGSNQSNRGASPPRDGRGPPLDARGSSPQVASAKGLASLPRPDDSTPKKGQGE
ncbi:hypothetical protein T484DRAFT_1899685 [Baffinella frigidus]|nr:hypothetical protein T484DRAFT_1899685 [Cryptophyta sp. CCMP2293]